MQITAFFQITLMLSFAVAQNKRYDSSEFAPQLKVVAEKKIELPLTPIKDAEVGKDQQTIDLLNARISAFDTLIKTSRTPPEKAQFLTGRILLNLQKAKFLSRNITEGVPPAEATASYKAAAFDADEIHSVKGLDNSTMSYASYLEGLALLGLNQKIEALKVLQKAVDLNPKAPYSSQVIFFMAEHYYEKEQFLASMKVLNTNLRLLDDSQKSLARYKMAWCYIGLHELSMAEEIFTDLIKSKAQGEFEKNLIKELSYISTQTRNETSLIAFADQVFAKMPDKKAEFLSSSYSNFQRQNSKSNHQMILSKLMGLASSSEQRIKLWLDEIRSNRKPHASVRPFTNFVSIQQELGRYGDTEAQKVLKKLGEDLELECEQLIRSYVGTYSDSVKNVEGIKKDDLSQSIKKLFAFQDQYFPKAKTRPRMFKLWLSLNEDTNDYGSMLMVSNKILADETLASLHPKAKEDRIIALGNLAKTEKEKYGKTYQQTLEDYAADETAPKWREYTGELANYYIQNKDFSKAIMLLSAINSKEKSDSSFYRLQTARFMAGQYREVVAARPPPGVPQSESMKNLVKEASLKLASKTDGGDSNFEDYENNINVFLSLNKDSSKEKVVLQDYIERLIQKKEYKKASLRVLTFTAEVRSKEYLAHTKKLGLLLMQEGDFKEASKIINENGIPISDQLVNESLLSRLGSGAPVQPREMNSLSGTNRDYLLGVLALTQPQSVIQYVSTFGAAQPQLKKIGLLALKIKEKSEAPILDTQNNRAIASLLPPEEAALTNFKSQVAEITFPKPGMSQSQSAKILATSVGKVRKTRQQIAEKIRGQSSNNQIEILLTAIRLEDQTAAAIEKSPIPAGLTDSQKNQYQRNMTEVASEFREQSKEFRKTLETIQSHSEEDQKKNPSDALPTFQVNQWVWPGLPIKERILRFIQEDNRTGALIMLDLRKTARLISDKDFYQFRSGILLSVPNNPPLARFVYNELKEAKQEGIITQWKAL